MSLSLSDAKARRGPMRAGRHRRKKTAAPGLKGTAKRGKNTTGGGDCQNTIWSLALERGEDLGLY